MDGFVLTQAWLEGNGACSDAGIFGERYPNGLLLTEDRLARAIAAYRKGTDDSDGDLNLAWLVEAVHNLVDDPALVEAYTSPDRWGGNLRDHLANVCGFDYAAITAIVYGPETTARFNELIVESAAETARLMMKAFDEHPEFFADFEPEPTTRTYTVTMTQTEYSRATVEVEAEDKDEAIDKADRLRIAGEVDWETYDWDVDASNNWTVEES